LASIECPGLDVCDVWRRGPVRRHDDNAGQEERLKTALTTKAFGTSASFKTLSDEGCVRHTRLRRARVFEPVHSTFHSACDVTGVEGTRYS